MDLHARDRQRSPSALRIVAIGASLGLSACADDATTLDQDTDEIGTEDSDNGSSDGDTSSDSSSSDSDSDSDSGSSSDIGSDSDSDTGSDTGSNGDLCLGPIHVDVDAPPDGDGTSWMTAFDDLQAAIDAAAGCSEPQLWVAEGSYAPDPASPVATIGTPMAIYGGFAGDEIMLEQRDVVAHPVTLGAPGWQARVVVLDEGAVDEIAITRLDGLRIDASTDGAIVIAGDQQLPPPITVLLHNLEITNNIANAGAGIDVLGIAGIEIVGSSFTNNAAGEGAAIHYADSVLHIHSSSFVANQSETASIYQSFDSDLLQLGHLYLSDSLVADNIGVSLLLTNFTADNVEFSNNDAVAHGDPSTITSALGVVTISNSTFVGNQGTFGAGLSVTEGFAELIDCDFVDNVASSAGAVFVVSDGYAPAGLTVSGGSFVGNSATGDAGALWVAGNLDASISDVVFVDNTAGHQGGAIKAADSPFDPPFHLEISGVRLAGNQATTGEGGGIYIEPALGLATTVRIVDTEFVDNFAGWAGGGLHGRAELVSVTFAGNLSDGLGDGVAAYDGPAMIMRNVVAWPDDINVVPLVLDHSCTSAVGFYTGIGEVILTEDPFEPSNLDFDDLTEFYLAPGSPCVDIGGLVDEYEWDTMTTQASQCTDVTPIDAGVHHAPLVDAGPC